MNIQTIDDAIDRYVDERKRKGKESARERFLAYAYLKYGGDDLQVFMKKVGGLTRYYINFLAVMENPFRGPELAWMALMFIVGIFSGYLLSQEEYRLFGIIAFSGTMVNGWALISAVLRKWLDVGVMIAIYREIVELVESEVKSTP